MTLAELCLLHHHRFFLRKDQLTGKNRWKEGVKSTSIISSVTQEIVAEARRWILDESSGQ